jgi:penicillin-binding protein 1C
MVLRSVFSELNREQDTKPLTLSRDLVLAEICRRDGLLSDGVCASTSEWFVPGTLPPRTGTTPTGTSSQYRLLQPTAGLRVAHDPRIPGELEALPMQIAPVPGLRRVDWYVDGELASSTIGPSYPWPLQHGTHSVHAKVWAAAPAKAAGTVAQTADTDAQATGTGAQGADTDAQAVDTDAQANDTDEVRFHVN